MGDVRDSGGGTQLKNFNQKKSVNPLSRSAGEGQGEGYHLEFLKFSGLTTSSCAILSKREEEYIAPPVSKM